VSTPARAALLFLFRTRGDALDARDFLATGLVTEIGEVIMADPIEPFMAVFISFAGKPLISCSLGEPLRFPEGKKRRISNQLSYSIVVYLVP
jgi:hypothetical protein